MNSVKLISVAFCLLNTVFIANAQNAKANTDKSYREEIVYTKEYKPGLKLALYHVWPVNYKVDTNKTILFLHRCCSSH